MTGVCLYGDVAEPVLVALQGGHRAQPGVGEVGHAGRPVGGVHGGLPAAQRPSERFPELCRERVVQNGIYGAEINPSESSLK